MSRNYAFQVAAKLKVLKHCCETRDRSPRSPHGEANRIRPRVHQKPGHRSAINRPARRRRPPRRPLHRPRGQRCQSQPVPVRCRNQSPPRWRHSRCHNPRPARTIDRESARPPRSAQAARSCATRAEPRRRQRRHQHPHGSHDVLTHRHRRTRHPSSQRHGHVTRHALPPNRKGQHRSSNSPCTGASRFIGTSSGWPILRCLDGSDGRRRSGLESIRREEKATTQRACACSITGIHPDGR